MLLRLIQLTSCLCCDCFMEEEEDKICDIEIHVDVILCAVKYGNVTDIYCSFAAAYIKNQSLILLFGV